MQDLIGYDEIIEKSMRSVIFETLKKIEKTGLPGKHYFVVTFATKFQGVLIPKHILEKYPEEMTIAIQHQFKSLVIEDEGFKISLSFAGKFEKLYIPYRAITSFADPSMNFALKFSMNYNDEDSIDNVDEENFANKPKDVDLTAKVISLDAFRKNHKPNSSDNS
jgi:hypothetical protein